MNRRNSRGSASLRSSDLAHLQNANSQLSQGNIGTLSPPAIASNFLIFWPQKLNLKSFFSDGSPKAENHQQKSQFSGNSRDMRAMGFIDFEDPEERAKEQEEKAREREIYIKERVNKLLFIWNRKESTEEFEKEKDPMVILELQKKLHNEMNEDFKVNIDNMTRYLSKKDNVLFKKQDPTA